MEDKQLPSPYGSRIPSIQAFTAMGCSLFCPQIMAREYSILKNTGLKFPGLPGVTGNDKAREILDGRRTVRNDYILYK